jgi:hypothetical protein
MMVPSQSDDDAMRQCSINASNVIIETLRR